MRYEPSSGPSWSPFPGKDLLSSRAFWGVAILVVSQVLARWGYTIEDKTAFIENAIKAIDLLGQLIGLGVSLWGTIGRKEPIRSVLGMRLN